MSSTISEASEPGACHRSSSDDGGSQTRPARSEAQMQPPISSTSARLRRLIACPPDAVLYLTRALNGFRHAAPIKTAIGYPPPPVPRQQSRVHVLVGAQRGHAGIGVAIDQ